MSANFSPVIQAVQISFLWRQEKMLQSCLRPTIPSVKLPPSKLFRILLRKLPTLEARFPLLPRSRPLIHPAGGGWVRTYFLEYRLLIKPIYTIFFDNAEKVRIHTFSSFWIVYTESFNRGISGDMRFLCVLLVASVPGSKILEKAHREKLRENRGEASLFSSHRVSLTRFITARLLFSLTALTKSLAHAILLAALVSMAPTKRLFFRTAPIRSIGSLELQARFCLTRKRCEKKLRFVWFLWKWRK